MELMAGYPNLGPSISSASIRVIVSDHLICERKKIKKTACQAKNSSIKIT